MPVGNQEPVFEDADHFFEGMDNSMQRMPDTIFLGPHVADRPFEETADFVRDAGTQEAKGQPAQITGGPGLRPESPVHGRERGYAYQEPMSPIRPDLQKMMTPVVSEPQKAEEPNRTVGAPIPPVSMASGLDYDKPTTDTLFIDRELDMDTPELLPHAGVAPSPGQRKAYEQEAVLLEGTHGNQDDGVMYNGEGYSTDQERHLRVNDLHVTIDDYAMEDEVPTPPEAEFRPDQSQGASIDQAAAALGGEPPVADIPSITLAGEQPPEIPMVMLAGDAPPEIPMVMLAEEPVADVPTITLAGLGFWPWARKKARRRARKLKGQSPAVVAQAVQQARNRKKKRRWRQMLRLSDTVKAGATQAILQRVQALQAQSEKDPQGRLADVRYRAARMAERMARAAAAQDPSVWERFTRGRQIQHAHPKHLPTPPAGFYWKQTGPGRFEILPVGPEAKELYDRAYSQLKQSERVKINEARHDLEVADQELDALRKPDTVPEVYDEARTPDELRAAGAQVVRKMLQSYGLEPTEDVVAAMSNQVAQAMLKDIRLERELAKREIAIRQQKLKIMQKGHAKARAAVPPITQEAFVPEEGGYF